MSNKPNKLINQRSPYLLQHAYNPVNWYPWCEEAFEKAKEEDKPVFLSIGYSTCHWCHVMAHESFEDEEIAQMMNEAFISIKVDREERPDIDGIYMTVCQMLTGNGGWPLTVIMTPEKKPFFAGTYFPKHGRFGRTGMYDLIPRIKELWQTKREEIFNTANEITAALETGGSENKFEVSEKIFDIAYEHFSRTYDSKYGGFGNAPKFPTPHNLMFLLRYWKRKKDPAALEMAAETLNKMRNGGIYDHIGYGFHRYSTDRSWLVPHFEKMLYDQALLSSAYTEAYLATGDESYKRTAEEILAYVMRDMTSPEGAFYSAEDADSEGEEGRFYVWTEEEISNIAGEEIDIIRGLFDIKQEGNWKEQSSDRYTGTNIIHLAKGLNEIAEEQNTSPDVLYESVKSATQKLFAKRESRIHPFKDDKILTDWNGLMISAFCKAYQAFGDDKYLSFAQNAVRFILTRLSSDSGQLFHRYRENEAGHHGILDDYSFLISALMDLYESDFNTYYLNKALFYNDYLINHFWDMENGGFFFTGDESSDLLVRQKEIYDGAVPSGNSVSMLNLIRLSRFTGKTEFEEKAYKIADAFSETLARSPFAFSQALIALDFALGPAYEIVIAGDKDSPETGKFLEKIRKIYLPNKIFLLNDGGDINKTSTFVENKIKKDNLTTLYVCKNYNCEYPVTSADKIAELLN